MENRILDMVLWVGLGLVFGFIWWSFWVEPHDRFNELISECMLSKDDMSMQSYKDCVDATRPR